MYNTFIDLDSLIEEEEKKDRLKMDYNDLVSKKVEEFLEQSVKRRELRYKKSVEDFFANLEYDEEGKPIFEMDEEGYAIVPLDDDGHPLIMFDEDGNLIEPTEEEESDIPQDDYTDTNEPEIDVEAQVQAILDDANMQAQMIIDDAYSQAEAIKNHAASEGEKDGYQEGIQKGIMEYQAKEAELENEKMRLVSEYNTKLEGMEQEVVGMVCDIVEKVFHIKFGDASDVIRHVVDNAIMDIENSNTFIIKVNEKNASYLKENKDELMEKIGSEALLDIVIDPILDDEGCIIETDGGIFDCSLDTQMSNLVKQIKALSVRG